MGVANTAAGAPEAFRAGQQQQHIRRMLMSAPL
jgi:hypothetical protein